MRSRRNASSDWEETTLLSRYFKYWILIAFLLFVGLQSILWFSPLGEGFCKKTPYFSDWTREYNTFVSGAFAISSIVAISRVFMAALLDKSSNDHRGALISSLVITLTANFSNTMSLSRRWGGVCEDAFGVRTSAEIWPEWFVCVPLLAAMTVSVDLGRHYSNDDLWTIIWLYAMVFFGALVQMTPVRILGIFFMGLCCVSFACNNICMVRTYCRLNGVIRECASAKYDFGFYEYLAVTMWRKKTLILFFGACSQLFWIFYFLAIFEVIDSDQLHVILMITSCITKILFCSLCIDAHMETSHPSVTKLVSAKKSHSARRAFLRYMFHEVRAPLNSISMGVHLMADSKNIDEIERETIVMMREATNYMGETLNDVLTIQKIEEGELHLSFKPFNIEDLLFISIEPLMGLASDKGVEIIPMAVAGIACGVIGDKYRLKHVIFNILSNAIKYSKVYGKVTVSVDASEPRPIETTSPDTDICMMSTYMFSVTDEGQGMSFEEMSNLFSPFASLIPGEFEDNNSGLGLAICKEIVEMHGGCISCSSEAGHGSTFVIQVPLQISKDDTPDFSRHLSAASTDKFASLSESSTSYLTNQASLFDVPVETEEAETSAQRSRKTSKNAAAFSSNLERLKDLVQKKRLSKSRDTASVSTDSPPRDPELVDRNHPQLQLAKNRPSSATTTDVHSLSEPECGVAAATAVATAQGAALTASSGGSTSTDAFAGASSAASTALSAGDVVVSTDFVDGISIAARVAIRRSRPAGASHSGEKEPEDAGKTSAESANAGAVTGSPRADSLTTAATAEPNARSDKAAENKPTNGDGVGEISENMAAAAAATVAAALAPNEVVAAYSGARLAATALAADSTTAITSPSAAPAEKARLPVKKKEGGVSYSFNTLVVDDVASNRKLLAMLLKKKGISPKMAEDGLEAVSLAVAESLDNVQLIFMDNTMPNMTGIQCAHELRKRGYKHIIIGITGNSLEEELEDFVTQGADLALTKPLKTSHLDVLLAHFQRHGVVSQEGKRISLSEDSLAWIDK